MDKSENDKYSYRRASWTVAIFLLAILFAVSYVGIWWFNVTRNLSVAHVAIGEVTEIEMNKDVTGKKCGSEKIVFKIDKVLLGELLTDEISFVSSLSEDCSRTFKGIEIEKRKRLIFFRREGDELHLFREAPIQTAEIEKNGGTKEVIIDEALVGFGEEVDKLESIDVCVCEKTINDLDGSRCGSLGRGCRRVRAVTVDDLTQYLYTLETLKPGFLGNFHQ